MREGHSKTSLILMELILVILFFALSATIYVRVFAGAYRISQGTSDRTQALMLAQKAAESFYASEGNPELLNRCMTGGEDLPFHPYTAAFDPCMAGAGRPPSAKQGWIYYYDEKGRLSPQKEALFCVTLVVRRRGEFLIGEIKVQKNRPDQAHRRILEKLVLRKYLP
ncbi:MAG: hypothetical protein HXK81_05265 [Lachnospiraceae bacterium]|nr:hypothetical protein [Lachnospiraceae bacterium]